MMGQFRIIPKLLLALIVVLVASAHAAEPLPSGAWYGADTAAISMYGYLVIADDVITWGDPNPKRKFALRSRPYKVIHEPSGTKYLDQLGQEHEVGEKGDYSSYRVVFTDQSSPFESLSGFRISFDMSNEGIMPLNLIEYDKSGKPTGYMHFYRVTASEAAELQPALEEHVRNRARR